MAHLETYEQFVRYLEAVGFMTLSGCPLGMPGLSELTVPDQWHTGLDTDPWQWKTRVVLERRAAYAKLFFRQPAFITAEWYPFFLAVRRGRRSFEDAWEEGSMSTEARRIHELFGSRSVLALHEIKRLGGFAGKSGGKFESAMTALQTSMFLTVSGMTRMTTMDGRPHSWPVTEFMPVEGWAWKGTVEQARLTPVDEAVNRIRSKIIEVSPEASRAKIGKLIQG